MNKKAFRLHICALVTSVLLWAYIASVIICSATGAKMGLDCSTEKKQECYKTCSSTTETCPSDCQQIMNSSSRNLCDNSCFGPWFLPIIICIPYILECILSKTFKYLRNGRNPICYDEFITQMKASPPSIQFKIECEYIENDETRPETQLDFTRKHTENSPTKRGLNKSQLELDHSPMKPKSQEIKETRRTGPFKKIEFFPVARWEDVIAEPEIQENSLARLRVKKGFDFANEYSRTYYKKQLANLIRQHHRPEAGFKSEEAFDIQNYKEFVTVRKGEVRVPICFHYIAFVVFSIVGLTWPYRVWVDRHAVEKEIAITKKVEVNEIIF